MEPPPMPQAQTDGPLRRKCLFISHNDFQCFVPKKFHPLSMKLLALHGHLQNAKRLRGQTHALSHFFKTLKIELVYLDAPFIAPESPDSDLRTWISEPSIDESYRTITAAKAAHPDAVGIFGFSMGGILALHMVAHAQTFSESPFGWIKIVVAVSSPFPREDSPLRGCFPCRCDIPVLLVIGKGDQIAVPERQRTWLEHFPNAVVFEHEGGHYVPQARQFFGEYAKFFQQYSDVQ
jgi:pimeloyl-ACP methyl ester carboxylesterase